DHEHRRLVVPGVGDSGHAVGHAGAGRDDGDAAAPRRARPAFGRVSGDLLVAHVDHAHVLVEARVVDRLHVPAAERENRVDAFLLDRADDEVAAVYQGHWRPPSFYTTGQVLNLTVAELIWRNRIANTIDKRAGRQ